jgi:resuscitation-promoting factor RpfB
LDYTSIPMTNFFPPPTHSSGVNRLRLRPSAFWMVLVTLFLLAACSPQVQPTDLTVIVSADGSSRSVSLPPGDTVQQALTTENINLASTDRVDPPVYTLLSDQMTVTVTRVREEFETRQTVVAFERQELRNESLTSGETRLVQAGQNGLNEITIRHVFENNVETSSSIVSETTLQEALPEIVMVGVQSPFAPVSIPGKLVYLTGGNAWVMDGSTSLRRPLITSGDLDGHIFSLSPDGKWLLFSRKSNLPIDQQINTLWAVSTTLQSPAPVDLKISNVVHFAAWQPGKQYQIAYSTVEPRATAPGWQANNDLHLLTFENGKLGRTFDALDANSGGLYGWWGTLFTWSPDGASLAYSRPDGIGLADLGGAGLTNLLDITPWNTHGDWAWTPGLAWGADGQTLYLVTHAPPSGLITPEESTSFDLTAISLSNRQGTLLVQQTGMFAYPAASPVRVTPTGKSYQVAYLQAVFPSQSATSRYRLVVMNADGTNQRLLFPAEGQPGLEPQALAWAPEVLPTGSDFIAAVYEGDLWIIDSTSGQSQQVTGDGLTNNIDWK